MNKLFLFGLLTLLFNSINGEIACKDWGSYFNQSTLDGDTCSMLVPTETGETHCCYGESSGSTTYAQCLGLTDDQYENIGRLINSLEDIDPNVDIKIDCSNKFLSLSLFAVAALLF